MTTEDKVREKFMGNVEKTSSCWLWTGGKVRFGYGRFYDATSGKTFNAHRYSYLLFKGPIPKELEIDHLCRVPACVNPAHLEIVTTKENVLRGYGPTATNARKTHCKYGHPFDATNTKRYKGWRTCRECHTTYDKKFRESHKKSSL